MALELQLPGTSLGLSRNSTVVAVPVSGAHKLAIECLQSALLHTPLDTPILIVEDRADDDVLLDFLQQDQLQHRVVYQRNEQRHGFVAVANQVFEATEPADVILLNSDCIVAEGWLSGMLRAAQSDTRVATVSTLTNHGSILSVPDRNDAKPELPEGWSVDRAAAAIGKASLRLYPEIPVAVGHCMLVRRRALELVGDFDEIFSPGYGEEVDFSHRCSLVGLSHVVADDVFVGHRGGASFGLDPDAEALKLAHKQIIDQRYPHHEPVVDGLRAVAYGPLPRALAAARRALSGLSVTVDGRCLTGHKVTGTAVHVLEVVAALGRVEGLALRVLVPDKASDYASAVFAAISNVELLTIEQAYEHPALTDIVHRPFQVMSEYDLELLPRLGERIVVTQQDMIAFNNVAYFESAEEWLRYRRLTRHTLALADLVLFFSRHAASEAINAEVISPERARVVRIGTDHGGATEVAASRPPALEQTETEFLVCLGTDFHHKNRLFALRLLEQLINQHSWGGLLVLAGATVLHGSSAADEAAFLSERPQLAERVVNLPAVDDEQREWLLREAAAVLYPSTYEGFGLLPFEAARAGTACLFAAQSSLAELLPAELATIEPWDLTASAAKVAALLSDDRLRSEHIAALLAAAEQLTWDGAATGFVKAYREVAEMPLRRIRGLAEEAVQLTLEIKTLGFRIDLLERQQDELVALSEELSAILDHDARALVGPDAVLPQELRRPLIAVSQRGWLRTLLFGPVIFAYRLGYLARHRRWPGGSR